VPDLNLDVPLEHCQTIIGEIYEVGLANPSKPDIRNVLPFSPLWEGQKYRHEALDAQTGGLTYRELVARYLYLRAPLDQGPDPEGIRMLLEQVTNQSYRQDIPFLHEPRQFFDNIGRVMEIIADEHEQVKGIRAPILRRERNVRAYSLFGAPGGLTLLTPHVMIRWGTPLANLMRFDDEDIGLLEWVQSHTCADAAALALRNDKKYGFGRAIGYKASRLFIKWLIHTYGVITQQDPRWGPNSYEIPLDSNVGRVLMRTGYIFPLLEGDPARTLRRGRQWTEQDDGRVNLSAQRLRAITIPEGVLPEIELEALLREWGLRNNKGERVLTRTLNAYLRALLPSGEAAIGVLDDGFMHIGTTYCYNTNPRCNACDVRAICWTNNVEAELRVRYYCGTGEGVFFG